MSTGLKVAVSWSAGKEIVINKVLREGYRFPDISRYELEGK